MSRVFGGLGMVYPYSRLSSKYNQTTTSTMTVEEVSVNRDMDLERPDNRTKLKLSDDRPTPSSNSVEGTGLLSQLLVIDEQLTLRVGKCARPHTKFQRFLKKCCMCLELSGHGVPWFALSGILLVLYVAIGDQLFLNYGLNLLAILVMDILVVAPMKLLFKRPRPAVNKGTIPLSMSSVDNYAFPSGHASRCVALAALFCYIPPFHLHTHLWYIWAIVVSVSRVIIGRHHLLDIGAGMLAGLVIFDLVRRFGLLVGV